MPENQNKLCKKINSNNIKWEILPSWRHVSTTVWLHHFDSDETLEEKKLDGIYAGMLIDVFKKILLTISYKLVVVRSLTSHI